MDRSEPVAEPHLGGTTQRQMDRYSLKHALVLTDLLNGSKDVWLEYVGELRAMEKSLARPYTCRNSGTRR
jgi:hypothetical protein